MDSISILSHLTNCVHKAGNFLINVPLSRRLEGQWDGEQFKSQADIDSHEIIHSFLTDFFPNVCVLSEESSSRCYQVDDYIIIDPIDGTRSYVEGYSGWVVQASFVRSGFPLCSVIYAPALGLTFHSLLGKGSFCNNVRLSLDRSKPITSIIDNYPDPRGISLHLYESLSLDNYIESGSIALKMCFVAAGKADLFVKDMCPRDWDIIPPLLLLSELGLFVSDLNFQPFHLNNKSLSHHGIVACRSLSQALALRPFINSYLTN